MKNPVALILTIFVLTGCPSDTGTQTSLGSVDHSAEPADSVGNIGPGAASTVASRLLPPDLSSFLEGAMPEWRLIGKAEWLLPGYLESYNANDAIADKLYYETEVWLKADLNGDGHLDYASFLIDAKNNVVLWAFHRTEQGFNPFKVSQDGQVNGCCVGAGLDLREPGLAVSPFNDGQGVDLKYDSIVYKIYEKSAQIYYFDGSAYRSFFVSD